MRETAGTKQAHPEEKTRRSAREAAFAVLMQVEKDQAYANIALNRVLNASIITEADARLAAQIVYGTVRRTITLDHLLQLLLTKPLDTLMPEAKVILRLSLFQLRELASAVPYAVTDEAVKLARRYANPALAGLVNAVLRNYLRKKDTLCLPEPADTRAYIHLTLSYPAWLADYFISRFGSEAVAFAEAGDRHSGLYLRTNTLRTSRQALIAQLAEEGITAAAAGLAPETLLVKTGGQLLTKSRAFADGLFLLQGPASQLAAHALSPAPGSRVLDLCAAPGGKTTHLAALMENRGEIKAFDLHPHRVALIEENARRLGIDIIEASTADGRELPSSLENWADYLLLDAPCSGLGVLSERPDSRYHKQKTDIPALAKLSAALLDAAVRYLKPGGRLCYATCTVTAEENGGNLARFLKQHPEFHLVPFSGATGGERQLLPQTDGTEGFFLALLEKDS